MPCIEEQRAASWLKRALGLGLSLVLAGCGTSRGPAEPRSGGNLPQAGAAQKSPGQPATAGAHGPVELAPAQPVRTHDELRLQAARRLVAANPERSYMGEVPAVLLAIPVLEVELNRDGSVKRVAVMREPGQARDTIQLAIDAVHRAAPYGDLSHLPRPWKFNEVFLFNDERRFKPRTLDD